MNLFVPGAKYRIWRVLLCFSTVFIFCSPLVRAQTSSATATAATPPSSAASGASVPNQSPASNQSAPELSSRDEVPTFKVRVNLVLVRVVVRDEHGKAIGNLKREDFQLFDNKKEQVITKFEVEQPGSRVVQPDNNAEPKIAETTVPSPTKAVIPEHYVAYVFDDIHLNQGDLMQVRNAADHHLGSLEPTARAAIFTTSGQNTLDFTDDHKALHQALLRLAPRPIARSGEKECPDISYYMADLIENKNDQQALAVAATDALACAFNNDSRSAAAARMMAENAAVRVLSLGQHDTLVTLGTLKAVVKEMALMPGQRTVVLVSPGFLNTDDRQAEMDVIETAVRSNVIISTLDARGLYVTGLGDISQPGPSNPAIGGQLAEYEIAAASADAEVLADFADGTGGSFFHNNNDLEGGFRRLTIAPENYYLLGFSPQKLKYDGSYHHLKVTLKNPAKFSVQARRGYYAPRHMAGAAEQAKQEIEGALFSQEEMHDVPADLHTQFFKTSDEDARIAVLVHLDVKRLHFQKVDGRNRNELTVVSALFDRNGQFVKATSKLLTMRLKDETLENKLASGITMKSSFEVKPGKYLVRLVVRDEEGDLAAESGAVEIP
jgi:VWFA-related protein